MNIKKPILTALALLTLIGLGSLFVAVPHAHAAYLQDRLIDDSVFLDANAMSPGQIQTFLAGKGSYLTNYSAAETLSSYPHYNQTVSAAQIIYDAGQVYGINPEVILSTLQKEESLVTAPSPSASQLNFAMGYGCFDSTGCSKSAGFYNQVDDGTWLLRFSFERSRGNNSWWNTTTYYACRNPTQYYKPGLFPGNNVTFYDDHNTAYDTFTISNASTASLYCYTPHAYPGSSQEYYSGSYNFVNSFNSWFGSTIGTLVRSTTDPTLYYSDGLSKYAVGSMDMVAQYGLGLGDVRTVSQADLDAVPLASSPDTPQLSYVVKSDSDSDADGGTIYLVNGGVRYPITTMTQFYNFGFTLNQLGYLPLPDLLRMPVGANLSNFVSGSDGFVYQVNSAVRNGIYDGNQLAQLDPGVNVTPLSSLVMNNLQLGTALLTGNTVMIGQDGSVYLVSNNTWYDISSMSLYSCLGLGNLPNIAFTPSQTTVGTQSSNISCAVQTSSGQDYLMDGSRRIPVDSSWGITTFNHIDDSLITGVPVYNPSSHPLFRSQSSGTLYALVNGKKDLIPSMTSFYNNGYTLNDIFTTSSDFLSTIPAGPYMLSSGMVMQDSSTGSLYVISGSGKLYIPSMTAFYDYGFSTSNIGSFNAATFAAYPMTGTISILSATPTPTLYDGGTAWQATSSALQTDFGFSSSTASYPSLVGNSVSGTQPLTPYVKFASSPTLYYMQNGVKRPVYSWATYTSLGGSLSNLTILSDSASSLFPTGPNM